jgi:DNA-binding transcriptional regulator WhiA
LFNLRWLVRQYRTELRWDRRNDLEKEELREILRRLAREIQRSGASHIIRRLNELGTDYRKNKAEIDDLRR